MLVSKANEEPISVVLSKNFVIFIYIFSFSKISLFIVILKTNLCCIIPILLFNEDILNVSLFFVKVFSNSSLVK